MTKFELLSTLLSCIAAVVSLVVWSGQRKLQRESNELQRITAELSRKQLTLLKEQEQSKLVAKLALSLVQDGKNYRLILRNTSDAEALGVDLRPVNPSLEESCLIPSEHASKFPVQRLRPGEEVRLIAALAISSPLVHEFAVAWKNADGSTTMEDFRVSL